MSTRILVVEDNAFSREMLCDWLELQGYLADSATSLAEAYAAINHAQPSAVLLDVQLGADDGLSLAEWLRKDKALCHLPVIAVTAHAMLTEQDRIMQAGCNVCISKPVDFESLKEQLDRWLRVAAIVQADCQCRHVTMQSELALKERRR